MQCPQGYCRQCNSTEEKHLGGKLCLYNQSNPNQCISSRDQNSYICGACKPGWSVAFGVEKCVKCDGYSKFNAVWIIPCILVVCVLVDASLIWLDIDIYSNYLNGFLYFCQILKLLLPSSLKLWNPMHFIVGIVNMESSGGMLPDSWMFCLFPGLDNLGKQIINYSLPTFMIGFLWVLGYFAKRPGSLLARTNKIKAFTIISVVAYADYTRITFLLMNKSQLDPDNPRQYVWIQGDVEYLSLRHIPYFIVAVFFLVFVVIAFPLVLVGSSR